MKKTFDDRLRAAFDAGVQAGRATNPFTGEHVYPAALDRWFVHFRSTLTEPPLVLADDADLGPDPMLADPWRRSDA